MKLVPHAQISPAPAVVVAAVVGTTSADDAITRIGKSYADGPASSERTHGRAMGRRLAGGKHWHGGAGLISVAVLPMSGGNGINGWWANTHLR